MAVTINGTTGIANDGGYTGDGVVFADTTPANTLVTTTGGNVGIGTSSPNGTLTINRPNLTNGTVFLNGATTGGDFIRLKNTGADGVLGIAGTTGSEILSGGSAYATQLYTVGATSLQFGTNGSMKAMIDSSGNLLVGTTNTTTVQGTARFKVQGDAGTSEFFAVDNFGSAVCTKSSTATQNQIIFTNPNGTVGVISTNGSATSYVTSSDYRLKENVQPMTGALARVAALKPVTYKWKVDGSEGEGFIAHELAEVCPAAVTGEKDAVDAEGNPQYQGIDVSFLVGTLTAAIQEQQAIITALTARVTALEGA